LIERRCNVGQRLGQRTDRLESVEPSFPFRASDVVGRKRSHAGPPGSLEVGLEMGPCCPIVQRCRELGDIESDTLGNLELLVPMVDISDLCRVRLAKPAQIPVAKFPILLACGNEGDTRGIRRIRRIDLENVGIHRHPVHFGGVAPVRSDLARFGDVVCRVVELVEVLDESAHDELEPKSILVN
jgi:hypothetical protein